MFHTQLNIKQLYPHAKNKSLPVYLTTREVSRLMDGVTNLKHKCIVQLLHFPAAVLTEVVNDGADVKVNPLHIETIFPDRKIIHLPVSQYLVFPSEVISQKGEYIIFVGHFNHVKRGFF